MRRNYISREFENIKIPGTFNMVEESNYFGSKMLEIEDTIYIENQNIIYYQNTNGEQLDLSIESSMPSYIYSSSDCKKNNHTISIDPSQSTYQKENNTKWIIDINLKSIIDDYLFAILKRYRTFEGMKTYMTKTNDVNTSVKNYIIKNVENRFKYEKIILYVKYKDIENQKVLRYNYIFNSDIVSELNIISKIQTELNYDSSNLKISFYQEKPSNKYTIEYYFNILFNKI